MERGFKIKILVLGLCFGFLFGVSKMPFDKVSAQSINEIFNLQAEINLSISPSNPQVGQAINASVQASGTNLDSNNISWYVNGVQKATGIGVKTFTTQVTSLGAPLVIKVRVTTNTGEVAERSFTVSAQDVDIVWESDSYTPPFYKGKALYTPEGNVFITAMPNIINKAGVRVAPSNLVYKWSINNSVLGDKSGYGRNVLFFSGSILAEQTEVMIEVTASDGTTGVGYEILAPQSPQTVLYENDPLYGVMFNNAITNGFKLKSSEIRVDAYPYFQSANNKIASNLTYSWSLNSTPIPVPLQKNSAVFRNSNNLNGTSLISVITENSTHILQQTQVNANLNF